MSPTPTVKQSTTVTRTEQEEGEEETVEAEEEELSPLEQHIKEADVIRFVDIFLGLNYKTSCIVLVQTFR